MGNEVLEQIIKIKDAVPKKQRILCNYLALNYEKIGVMTVAELAENAGVGSTTVMRLRCWQRRPVSRRTSCRSSAI